MAELPEAPPDDAQPDVRPDAQPDVQPDALIVDVEGFEGPLDVLLALARAQRVDLREVSLLALAEQYLAFVERAARARLALSADYLVMAAWLAFLKSRLLLPEPPGDEPEAEDPARDLAARLARLEALRGAAAQLMARPRRGRDVFARGAPEGLGEAREVRRAAGLHDLLMAYARVRTRDEFRPYALGRPGVMTMEEALGHLGPSLGAAPGWADLALHLPPGWQEPGPRRRSATAATFAALLELVRAGRAELRQDAAFAPVLVRAAAQGAGGG
jgi:segregation and condensation protein A